MEQRQCKVCKETKPLSSFGTTVSEGNGRKYRRHECRSCTYKRQENWREKNRGRLRELGRQATDRMRKRRLKADPVGFRRAEAAKAKEYREVLKHMVYKAYGGVICACCGETEPKFLSVDHVNNDGYTLRKNGSHGSGALIYQYLWQQKKKTGDWPDGYQILCMNCQHGKARNGGICPHKQGVTTSRRA